MSTDRGNKKKKKGKETKKNERADTEIHILSQL